MLRQAVDWAQRARICETCSMRRIVRGVSYCGRPFLQQVQRDHAEDGCGCPCHDKARDPSEHCPIDERHRPATRQDGACTCKWCAAAARLDVLKQAG